MMRQLTLAVTFLTGIPLPLRGAVAPTDLWRSMGWYPLVGLALGAAAWGVYAGLLALLPSLVAAVLVVLLLEAVTRGPVSYTHLRAHETRHDLVCRLLLEKKKTQLVTAQGLETIMNKKKKKRKK